MHGEQPKRSLSGTFGSLQPHPRSVTLSETPDPGTQFHILSFEGPDPYSRIGGLETRVSGLAQALVEAGHDTHLWYVGAPELAGHEYRSGVHLHRWCQWLSLLHPVGVYDGEAKKEDDYTRSLPPFLLDQHLAKHLRAGGRAVVLAEEWQTARAVLHLHDLLVSAGLRERVQIFWNANNVFGFDEIDWPRLREASTVTTVSRYMRHIMLQHGVEAVVIPNGLSSDAYDAPDRSAVNHLRRDLAERMIITKMARWDPDKRWLATIGIVRELKQQGYHPLFIARGGRETYGREVLSAIKAAGLRMVDRAATAPGLEGMMGALDNVEHVDVVNLLTHVDPDSRRVIFRASDVVLANSGHEPFGLVGLEAMAVGGIACTGCSGEDYAAAGRNALVLQTSEPQEFVGLYAQLLGDPARAQAMRRAGRITAKYYSWAEVLRTSLMPRLSLSERRPLAASAMG